MGFGVGGGLVLKKKPKKKIDNFLMRLQQRCADTRWCVTSIRHLGDLHKKKAVAFCWWHLARSDVRKVTRPELIASSCVFPLAWAVAAFPLLLELHKTWISQYRFYFGKKLSWERSHRHLFPCAFLGLFPESISTSVLDSVSWKPP